MTTFSHLRKMTFHWCLLLCILLITKFITNSAIAQSLSITPTHLFKRCFERITGGSIAPNDPRLMNLQSATHAQAVDSCMALINLAELDTVSGVIRNNSIEGRAVLQNFNTFHRSWFLANDFEDEFDAASRSTAALVDQTEPALFLTRALFYPNADYSEVFTSPSAMEAVRSGGSGPVSIMINNVATLVSPFLQIPVAGFLHQTNQRLLGDTESVFTQVGELLGVRRLNESAAKYIKIIQASTETANVNTPIAYNQSFGGGVIGAQSYLILNHGRLRNERMNGGNLLLRRWSMSIMRDLLCKEMPALRYEDAQPLVTGSSFHAFRLASNCQACHGTIDQMASAARNLTPRTNITPANNANVLQLVSQHNINASAPAFQFPPNFFPVSYPATAMRLPDNDANFYQRNPDGKLFYRAYDGSVVNIDVAGLSDLGQKIALQRDPYVCAARKYFEYFTGIRANIQDLPDPTSIDANGLEFRQFVIQLGENFYNHQDLKQLVREILQSPYFRQVDPTP